MEERILRKQSGYRWLLYALSAAFSVVSLYRGGKVALSAYVFSSVIVFPGFFVLLGQESRQKQKQELLLGSAGFFVLGFVQKVVLFWAEYIAGITAEFELYYVDDVSWLFFVSGIYFAATAWIRPNAQLKSRLLEISVLFGLAVGFAQPVGDYFCLSRCLVYLPFYLLGRKLDLNALALKLQKVSYKLLSTMAVGGWAVVCFLLRRKWKGLRGLFDANRWYGGISALPRQLFGPVCRLAWYFLAFALFYAVFCIVPMIRLPLLTEQGKRWKSGYFWFAPCACLFCMPIKEKTTISGLAVVGVLCLLGLLIAPSRIMSGLPETLFRAPEILFGEDAKLQRKHGTFYVRHQWGIDILCLFTLLFAIASVALACPFSANGRNLIWNTDGLTQQYPMMFYFKEYVLESLKQGHFAQWDFRLGYGMSPFDVLRREPFMIFSLLGTAETMEAIYNLVVLLRVYVCGLAFMLYCGIIGKREKLPVLMGTLTYCFCGFCLFAGGRQSFFTTVFMTYLVLLLAGVERYLRKGKFDLFVCAVFLQLFNAFYSSYVNSLVLAVYLLVRLCCLNGKKVGKTIGTIIKMIGLYAWGAGIAMVTLLPGVLAFSNSAREHTSQRIGLFYNTGYYLGLLSGMNLNIDAAGYWVHIDVAAICWLACVLLFRRKRKELLPLKVGLGAAAVLLTFPVFGLISNGFAYVINRWTFAVPFLLSLILVEMAPDLADMKRGDRGIIGLSAAAYLLVVVPLGKGNTLVQFTGYIILALTALVLLIQDQYLPEKKQRMVSMLALVMASVMIGAEAVYLPGMGNYSTTFGTAGQAYQAMSGNMEQALETLQDDSFYRVGSKRNRINRGMALNYYGTSSYFSVSPKGVSQYFVDLAVGEQTHTFSIEGMDYRSTPMALGCVKYYVADKKETAPYGFEQIAKLDHGAALYENKNVLPLGYTYTSYVTPGEYNKMTPLQRQEVMLHSAVLGITTTRLEWNRQPPQQEHIPVKIDRMSHVQEEKQQWTSGEGGSLRMTFDGKPNCETYLVVEGLRFANSTSGGRTNLLAESAVRKAKVEVRGKYHSYYYDVDAAIFHLGYSEEALKQCTLTFEDNSSLKYDDCYVVCIPRDRFAAQVAALKQVSLENVKEQGEYLYGTIDLEEDRLLALSVPYAPGWRAKVDGTVAQVLQVNVMYSGLLLGPGHHVVELRYQPPGLAAGAAVSLLSAAALVVYDAFKILKKRKYKKIRVSEQNTHQ